MKTFTSINPYIPFHTILSRLILFLILCSSSGNILAISEEERVLNFADSLLTRYEYNQSQAILIGYLELDPPIAESSKVKLYSLLIEAEVSSSDFEEAFKHIKELEQISAYQDDKILNAKIEFKKARIYNFTGCYDLSVNLCNRIIHKIKRGLEEEEEIYLYKVYNLLGANLHYLRSEKAEQYYLKSIEYSHRAGISYYSPPYNNLVDYYLETLNYKAAANYVDSLFKFAREKGKSPNRIINAKTKRAHLFAKIGQGEKAKKLLEECQKIRDKHSIIAHPSLLILDSYVHQANGVLDSAIVCAELVLAFAQKKEETGFIETCMEHLAQLYSEAGKPEKAAKIYEQLIFQQKQVNKIRQLENITDEEIEMAARVGKSSKASFLPHSIFLFSLISIFFFFFQYQIKVRQKKNNADKAKIRSWQSQLHQKTELLTKTELIHQQNLDFLSSLKRDLHSLGRNKAQLQKNVNQLIHKINQNIRFHSNWEQINKHFSELFPCFIPYLKNRYPKLTDTELRHCIFLKLNLTIDEVAQILNIEVRSVSSARYRLRKKIDVDSLLKVE